MEKFAGRVVRQVVHLGHATEGQQLDLDDADPVVASRDAVRELVHQHTSEQDRQERCSTNALTGLLHGHEHQQAHEQQQGRVQSHVDPVDRRYAPRPSSRLLRRRRHVLDDHPAGEQRAEADALR